MRRGKHRKVKARDRLEQLVARPSAWNKPRDSMDWDGWMDGWMTMLVVVVVGKRAAGTGLPVWETRRGDRPPAACNHALCCRPWSFGLHTSPSTRSKVLVGARSGKCWCWLRPVAAAGK